METKVKKVFISCMKICKRIWTHIELINLSSILNIAYIFCIILYFIKSIFILFHSKEVKHHKIFNGTRIVGGEYIINVYKIKRWFQFTIHYLLIGWNNNSYACNYNSICEFAQTLYKNMYVHFGAQNGDGDWCSNYKTLSLFLCWRLN